MIGRLYGRVLEKQPPQIIIDVQGVGYEVDVSMQTFYTLPALGESVQLYTQLIVREDAHLLFGFASKEERTTFRQLLKVSGIGAKTALGVLSAMTTEELASSIANDDLKRLSSIPGIGKKTAERMILELRGKLSSDIGGGNLFTEPVQIDGRNEMIAALQALGYNEKEAKIAVKDIPLGTEIGEGVRLALRQLLK